MFALLVAVEANRRLDMIDTRQAFQRAIVRSPSLTRFVQIAVAPIEAGNLDPGGRSVTVAYHDSTVRRFDLGGHRLGGVLHAHHGPVSSTLVSPHGRVLATAGSADGTVRLSDTRSLHPLARPMKVGLRGTESLAFSPDGTVLAATGNENTVRRWSVPTGAPIGQPTTIDRGLNTLGRLAFSPDGLLIAVPFGVWRSPESLC